MPAPWFVLRDKIKKQKIRKNANKKGKEGITVPLDCVLRPCGSRHPKTSICCSKPLIIFLARRFERSSSSCCGKHAITTRRQIRKEEIQCSATAAVWCSRWEAGGRRIIIIITGSICSPFSFFTRVDVAGVWTLLLRREKRKGGETSVKSSKNNNK